MTFGAGGHTLALLQKEPELTVYALDRDPDAQTAIDPYAAEDPAEFFAVTSEYFFTAPDLLHEAYPAVYRQLQLFYRQDPLQRLRRLQAEHPDYREAAGDTTNG